MPIAADLPRKEAFCKAFAGFVHAKFQRIAKVHPDELSILFGEWKP